MFGPTALKTQRRSSSRGAARKTDSFTACVTLNMVKEPTTAFLVNLERHERVSVLCLTLARLHAGDQRLVAAFQSVMHSRLRTFGLRPGARECLVERLDSVSHKGLSYQSTRSESVLRALERRFGLLSWWRRDLRTLDPTAFVCSALATAPQRYAGRRVTARLRRSTIASFVLRTVMGRGTRSCVTQPTSCAALRSSVGLKLVKTLSCSMHARPPPFVLWLADTRSWQIRRVHETATGPG